MGGRYQLLTTELPGTRQLLEMSSEYQSCCSISQHFISRRLINRHPNQLNQSTVLQQPLGGICTRRGSGRAAFPAPARGWSRGTEPGSGTRPREPLNRGRLGNQRKYSWLICYYFASLHLLSKPSSHLLSFVCRVAKRLIFKQKSDLAACLHASPSLAPHPSTTRRHVPTSPGGTHP